MKIIPIVYAINDKYAPFALVSIESILDNASSNHIYKIYILYTDLIEENKKLLLNINLPNNFTIELIDVNSYIKNYEDKLYTVSFYSKEMYYRFLIPLIFKKYKKVIYLDSDTIILTDIKKLYSKRISFKNIGAVVNFSSNNMKNHANSLGLKHKEYINSGILVYNTKNCLKNNFSDKCFELALFYWRGFWATPILFS